MNPAEIQQIARLQFRPEYQRLAAILDDSIKRNPGGWELWFAIKNDERERTAVA